MSAFQKQIYDMLMESQFWSPEQMLAFQRSQLSQLLKHARAQVPFYKDRIDPVFKRNGDIDWDRWHEIPIVTRADLRDKRDEMLAVNLPAGHGPSKTYYSSGSSGVPIAVESTQILTHVIRATAHRFYRLQSMDSSRVRAVFPATFNTDGIPREESRDKQRSKESPTTITGAPDVVLDRSMSESCKLDLLQAGGAAYLNDFPNNAEVLARANLSRKPPVSLEVILCFGQGPTADQRKLFQASFGARSVSIYSSQEGGLMACQCGDSAHYHLNPEIVFAEILAADGRRCEHGEQGRVVITPLFSTALPLIRYEQGDTAELQPACTCNSKLPVIANITGRQDQLLRFPEGTRSATGLSQKMIFEKLNALAFQLAQTETYKLELRFIPADASKQISPGPIVAHIRELIHPQLDVIFKPVEKIPLNAGGKQQRIVCEIPT